MQRIIDKTWMNWVSMDWWMDAWKSENLLYRFNVMWTLYLALNIHLSIEKQADLNRWFGSQINKTILLQLKYNVLWCDIFSFFCLLAISRSCSYALSDRKFCRNFQIKDEWKQEVNKLNITIKVKLKTKKLKIKTIMTFHWKLSPQYSFLNSDFSFDFITWKWFNFKYNCCDSLSFSYFSSYCNYTIYINLFDAKSQYVV